MVGALSSEIFTECVVEEEIDSMGGCKNRQELLMQASGVGGEWHVLDV
jgi:hypothetical protein